MSSPQEQLCHYRRRGHPYADAILCYGHLMEELRLWTHDPDHTYHDCAGIVAQQDKPRIYAQDLGYLYHSADWHASPYVCRFFDRIAKMVGENDTILDVGCESGMSGLTLGLLSGCKVVFHDFPGQGPLFALHQGEKDGLRVSFIPYGDTTLPYAGYVLAIDMLEHTDHHMATLRWLGGLGKVKVVTYPATVRFEPPYRKDRLDEWVDDEAILWLLQKRHRMIESYLEDGRRYLVYE